MHGLSPAVLLSADFFHPVHDFVLKRFAAWTEWSTLEESAQKPRGLRQIDKPKVRSLGARTC